MQAAQTQNWYNKVISIWASASQNLFRGVCSVLLNKRCVQILKFQIALQLTHHTVSVTLFVVSVFVWELWLLIIITQFSKMILEL